MVDGALGIIGPMNLPNREGMGILDDQISPAHPAIAAAVPSTYHRHPHPITANSSSFRRTGLRSIQIV